MSYLVSGNNPAAIKTAERNIFTATAGQTTFTITQGYQPGDIDVFLNGVRLIDSDDYTATNGSTVVLTSGATVNDSLAVICYRPYQVTDFYTKSEQDTRYVNVAGDTMTGRLGINVTATAPITIGREDTSVEGGQLDLCRASDNVNHFGIDVYGSGTTPSLRIVDNVAGAVRLQIDSTGRVRTPNQPAFLARITGGATVTTTATKLGVGLLTEVFDITNNFDHVNSTFQAPVAGKYVFVVHWAPNTTGRMNTYFYVNSVSVVSLASANGGASASILLNLAQGDTVETYWQSSTGSSVAVDNSGMYYGYYLG